jgi:hypothetical protein
VGYWDVELDGRGATRYARRRRGFFSNRRSRARLHLQAHTEAQEAQRSPAADLKAYCRQKHGRVRASTPPHPPTAVAGPIKSTRSNFKSFGRSTKRTPGVVHHVFSAPPPAHGLAARGGGATTTLPINVLVAVNKNENACCAECLFDAQIQNCLFRMRWLCSEGGELLTQSRLRIPKCPD